MAKPWTELDTDANRRARQILNATATELSEDPIDDDANDFDRLQESITWLGYVIALSAATIVHELGDGSAGFQDSGCGKRGDASNS